MKHSRSSHATRKSAPDGGPIPQEGVPAAAVPLMGSSPVSAGRTGTSPADPEGAPKRESQRFIKNSIYFTICIYAAIMAIITATVIKLIIDFDTTRAWFGQVAHILGPFIFGALLAYILNPMVHMFYNLITRAENKLRLKWRLNHSIHTGISILATYIIVFGFIIFAVLYVVPELINNMLDFANYIPHAYDSLLDLLNYLQEEFPSLDMELIIKPVTDTVPDLITVIRTTITNMIPAVYTMSMSIASWIINVLITIIVSVYMLYDKHRIMRSCWRVIYAFLPERHIPAAREILGECNKLFSSFVVGKFLDSTIIGLLCFVLMTILRLEYSPLISLIVGITNMIPYFGPFIGAIPGALILVFIKPLSALAFCIMILCLQQFDGLILGPKILGDSTGIKPLWIIFAITVGGSLAGVVGMFLGVPAVAFLSYLIDRYLQYRLKKRGIPESRVDETLENTINLEEY